ncbi:SO2930 family diheme c-type cytochrome [Citromicrobium bathyomarinum]|uniref:SO2930 family diheme c-type cytochrome n=1 Tax=Citromicrobium bathyomarinum TaxID=72174 RepID=UPI00315A69FC
MNRHLAILAAAAATLALSAGVSALPPPQVNDPLIADDSLPRTLGDYGFFLDVHADDPAPGVKPYRLNMPLFSDGATKLRYIYVPEGAQVDVGEQGLLQFPVGSALIKTFAFGEGDAMRKIETRVLLHRADGWVALPYVWNEAQTEATLVLAGKRVPVTTPWGEDISYRVPNKNQCKECHGLHGAVTPIGPKTRNLSAQWLQAFLGTVPEGSDTMPLWEDRKSAGIEAAARAYLDVNCAHCHRPGSTASNSGLDLRWETRDPHAFGIDKRPVAAGRGSGGLMFDIVPGDPEASILAYRMKSAEPGVAMPELGKATVHEEGVALVERWIAGMPAK